VRRQLPAPSGQRFGYSVEISHPSLHVRSHHGIADTGNRGSKHFPLLMDRGCGLVASEQMPSEQKNKGSDHRESEKIRNHGGQERDTITTLGAYRSCLQQLLLHRCHFIDSFPQFVQTNRSSSFICRIL
jgi:hypothetical protein